MAKTIGDLAVRVSADLSKYFSQLDKAKRGTDSFASKLTHSFAGATKGAAMLTAGFSAIGGAVALAISKALDYADAIGKAADQSGVTTDRIQEMRYAFGFFGLSVEQTDKSLQDFNRKLGEFTATGSGEGKIAFEALDISVKNLDGSLKSTEEVLDEAYNKLGRIEDPAQRAALAVKLFGEEAGPKIANSLKNGSAAIDDLRNKAHELNLVLSEDTVRSAEEVNDKLSTMSQVMQMTLYSALADVMPQIEEFVNLLSENTSTIVGFAEGLVYIATKIVDVTRAMVDFGKQTGMLSKTIDDEIRWISEILEDGVASWDESLRFFGPNGWVEYWNTDELKARLAELQQQKADLAATPDGGPLRISITGGQEAPFVPKMPTSSGSKGASAAEKEAKRLDDLAKKYKALIDPIQRYRDELNEVEMLYAKGKLTQDERLEALMNINDAIDEQIDKTDELTEAEKKAKDAAAEFGDIMTSAFEDAILAGGDFGDVLQGLAEDILRLMLRQNVTKPLAEAIGGIDFGSLLSGLFSSGKAGGGRVYPGSIQPVGERGPELFVPDGPGTIMPNYLLGGSGSGGGNVNIEIINQGTAQTVTGQSQSQDAAGMVIQLMLDDLNTGGKISQGYTRAFGLRRGGG